MEVLAPESLGASLGGQDSVSFLNLTLMYTHTHRQQIGGQEVLLPGSPFFFTGEKSKEAKDVVGFFKRANGGDEAIHTKRAYRLSLPPDCFPLPPTLS
jgi:hypothetical protein